MSYLRLARNELDDAAAEPFIAAARPRAETLDKLRSDLPLWGR